MTNALHVLCTTVTDSISVTTLWKVNKYEYGFQFRGSVHHTMIIEKHQLDAAR